MSITIEQREQRRHHIGSSDAAAIMGFDPYRNRADVYFEKTASLDELMSRPADMGNRLESAILDWCEEQIGETIERDVRLEHHGGILAVNLDGVVDTRHIVEAKSTGLADEWGEPLTDQVPDRVIVQTQLAMHVAGAALAYVPVLIGSYGLRFELYEVPAKMELGEAIASECERFWRQHVEPRLPPEGFVPQLSTLKRIRREPESSVRVPDELVRRWLDAKDEAKRAAGKKDHAQAALLAALGDAEAAETNIGRVTYLESQRKGYEVKPTTYRTLRYKSG